MTAIKKLIKIFVAFNVAVAILLGLSVPTLAAQKHKVTFIYGTKSYVAVVDEGCTALPPTDTYVPGYVFMGWVGNSTNVKSDLTILGAYSRVDTPAPIPAPAPTPAPALPQQSRTYCVKFVDSLTGGTYWNQTVSEGADANPPEVPYHTGYHFDGYDGTFTNVHSDRTIYARYGRDFGDWHDDPEDWWWYWEDDNGDYHYEPCWWY